MEIKLLQNIDWRYGEYLKENLVLEKSEYESEFPYINRIKYELYNVETNERVEILPNIEKYNIGDIVNVSMSSDYIYFVNLYENNKNDVSDDDSDHINNIDDINGVISIIRYNILTKETDSVYSYNENISELNKTKRIKLFIVNNFYLIIQNEYLVQNSSQTYAGFFKFALKMYNLKDETEYIIADENFTKNGISNIIPLSETQAVIKTGFSLLEDNRYNVLEQEECSLEALSFVNISQMISDLIIGQTSVALETIEQAYYTNTISYVKKSKNYLIYSCINNETKEEEVKFYNLTNKEIKSCINQDVIRESDLANPYIINSEPYICIIKEDETSFLNLNTNKIELKNDEGLKLRKIFEDTVLFSGIATTLLTKKIKPFFDIISFPRGELLHHEQNEYVDSFMDENNNIYVIMK